MSSIYTCGRMHKQRKLKLCSPGARAKAMADAVYKIMQEELSESACERWCSRLNVELGPGCFKSSDETVENRGSTVPHVWVPSKPKITLALLSEFKHASEAETSQVKQTRVGSDSVISKVLARHAVVRLRQDKGLDWLRSSDELTVAQLQDHMKLTQALSRAAFDILVYVHARALELKQESDVSAVIELHSSDQTLVGKAMRGCGVVFCEKGRELFASAVTTVQNAMSVSNCDTI